MQFKISIIRDIIYGATAHGANFKLLCEKAGLAPHELNDSEKMVDWEIAPYLWDHIIELTSDHHIGLHMGQDVRPSVFGITGHLIQTCKTAESILETISVYNNMWSTVFKLFYERRGGTISFSFEPTPLFLLRYPVGARQSIEMSMSGILQILHVLCGKKINPEKTCLSFPKDEVSFYQKAFRSEIIFNASKCFFIFNAEALKAPVLSHDESLFTLFSGILQEKQKIMTTEKTFAGQVRLVLLGDFSGQLPPIEVIASHMNLNTRTFQRKLTAEKTTYRSICQELRKQLSLAIMKLADKKVRDIASLVGYSNHNSFRRAFKKWTP